MKRLLVTELELQLEKCQLMEMSAICLRLLVSSSGIATDTEKIKVIKEWQKLSTLSDLRSFLVLRSYFLGLFFGKINSTPNGQN